MRNDKDHSLMLLLFDNSGERVAVRFAFVEVDSPAHKFTPLPLFLLPQVISNLNNEVVQLLNPSIDVAFLGIRYRPKFVLFFNYLIEVPKFRRPAHVLAFQRVVNCFQIFEGLSCTFQLLILPFLARKHSVSNDSILDVLVYSLVDVLETLNSFVNDLVSEFVIAVVFPNPIPAQLLNLKIIL